LRINKRIENLLSNLPDGERVKVPYLQIRLLVRITVRLLNLKNMRTNKREKKSGIGRPEVRSLKIQPRFRENEFSTVNVPEIKLCGNWLSRLGFCQGRRVIVTTMNELLIVRLQPE